VGRLDPGKTVALDSARTVFDLAFHLSVVDLNFLGFVLPDFLALQRKSHP